MTMLPLDHGLYGRLAAAPMRIQTVYLTDGHRHLINKSR
jgi:hypothetical protein